MRRTVVLLFVIVDLYVAAGCATGPRHAPPSKAGAAEEAEVVETVCASAESVPQMVTYAEPPQTEPAPSESSQASLLLSSFSPRAREMAGIIGIQDLVAQLRALEAQVAEKVDGARVRLLELRQQIADRLLLASLEASSIAAELECEKGRSEDLASQLEEVQNSIQNRRTVIAIVADAVSGLLSGGLLFLGLPPLAGTMDVIGNTLQGGYGLGALGGQQQHELRHERNLLAEVWNGPDQPRFFPMSVWRFLNQGTPRPRREALALEWRRRLGPPGSELERRRTELFFGGGGTYTVEELRYRGEMLDRLKASVRLMAQDLNVLFRETLSPVPKPVNRNEAAAQGDSALHGDVEL